MAYDLVSVFFFKQKTAYEMRISDWSSDVCSSDLLGAVLGDAAALVFLADHEAGDVLQEHDRRAGLIAQLDEMRALERGVVEQHAVVGEDANLVAPQMRVAADQGLEIGRAHV